MDESGKKAVHVPERNHVEVNGVCCDAPLVKMTPGGKRVFFVLRVKRTRGENPEKTETAYIPMVAWDRAAEWCEKVVPGQALELSGHISTWGQDKKSKMEVTVTGFRALVTAQKELATP